MSQDALLITRWIHYFAGVMWIGHLYFFNFVNLNYQKDVPAELKKTVNPPLLLRVLFFFRWGAMFTFLSGLLMLAVIYGFPHDLGRWAALFPSAESPDTMKGAYMAMGAIFGTIMWFNVWFIIWPGQKKVLGAMQGGPAADPAIGPRVLMASRINTYLSVPMLLGMLVGAHSEYTPFGGGWTGLLIGLALGLAMVWGTYQIGPKVSAVIFKAP